ncbi:MAG: response regulator transcription factor [Acidimicrobiales bacterium]|nr:response regulator transcription factor [Acidimicrobiales bacterium]
MTDMSRVGEVRVLIVDDQAPFREAMRMVVDVTDGFVCVGEARTGVEAVELAASLRPDLVLIDVQMPVMDGLEATQRICRHNSAVRVFVLSTHESGDFEGPATAAGAAAFLPKSLFGMEVLSATWDRVGPDTEQAHQPERHPG